MKIKLTYSQRKVSHAIEFAVAESEKEEALMDRTAVAWLEAARQ